MKRLVTAFKAFWSILFNRETQERWRQLEAGVQRSRASAVSDTEKATASTDEEGADIASDAVYTLTLLQREGRLVDFLLEEISSYTDAQVGAAVRQIHDNCRNVLQDNFGIEAIRPEPEGATVQVSEALDPQQVRLIGNASATPPFSGALRHPGWKVTRVDFPERHSKRDPAVVRPAEIEVT